MASIIEDAMRLLKDSCEDTSLLLHHAEILQEAGHKDEAYNAWSDNK